MILLGDCLERLKELEENSVDALVSDPPYGWRFMGKAWDGDDIVRMTEERMQHQQTLGKDGKPRPSPRCAPSESAGKYDLSLSANKSFEIWTTEWAREALRVLKPGAHAIVFCGPRTYHRMAAGVEDAGFEIRDQLQWLFGSGFPKSLDISKAIDKKFGAKREVIGDAKRSGSNSRAFQSEEQTTAGEHFATKPSTPEAYRYKGWGTALKPANEPIVLARKPLRKGLTVAENMLKWGVGGLNIDESRIQGVVPSTTQGQSSKQGQIYGADQRDQKEFHGHSQGRWPANLLLDETAAQMLDQQSGISKSTGGDGYKNSMFCGGKKTGGHGLGDTGGASRFFYVAKASKRERNAGLDKTNLVWEKDAWEKPDLKLALKDVLQLAKDTSDDTLTVVCSWNTEQCGLPPTEKSRQDLIFTISTALKLITELRTSNAFQSSSIRENIQDAIETIEANGLSLVESVASISQLLPNITSEKTASVLGVVHALLPMLLKIKGFAKSGNFHSTVKPIKLMEYLIKLITPAGGTILDPFCGSGSTGVAAFKNGFKFIGIEQNADYVAIAEKRINHAKDIA